MTSSTAVAGSASPWVRINWFTFDHQLMYTADTQLMHSWYAADYQIIHSWYTADKQLIHSWYKADTQPIHSRYTADTQPIHSWYTADTHYTADTQPIHSWYTADTQPIHSWYTAVTQRIERSGKNKWTNWLLFLSRRVLFMNSSCRITNNSIKWPSIEIFCTQLTHT